MKGIENGDYIKEDNPIHLQLIVLMQGDIKPRVNARFKEFLDSLALSNHKEEEIIKVVDYTLMFAYDMEFEHLTGVMHCRYPVGGEPRPHSDMMFKVVDVDKVVPLENVSQGL